MNIYKLKVIFVINILVLNISYADYKHIIYHDSYLFKNYPTPFYLKINLFEYQDEIISLPNKYEEDSAELMVFKIWNSIINKNEILLKNNSIYENGDIDGYVNFIIERLSNKLSYKDKVLYRIDIGNVRSYCIYIDSLKKLSMYSIVMNNDQHFLNLNLNSTFFYQFLVNGIVSYLDEEAVIKKDISTEYNLLLPVNGRIPDKNPVFLSFDAKFIDKYINQDMDESEVSSVKNYIDIYNTIVNGNIEEIENVVTPDLFKEISKPNNNISFNSRLLKSSNKLIYLIENDKSQYYLLSKNIDNTSNSLPNFEEHVLIKQNNRWKLSSIKMSSYFFQMINEKFVRQQLFDIYKDYLEME